MATKICAMIGARMALGQVADQRRMPCVRTIMNWLSHYPEFADLYAKAVEARAEYWAAELMSLGRRLLGAEQVIDPKSGQKSGSRSIVLA
jgi:hypothetical protein